jgi:hypothetical protein
MPKKVKKIIVIIFAFTLGCIITLSLTTNAESQLASESVGYDNTNSGSTKTTVKDAIDELYEKANTTSGVKCPEQSGNTVTFAVGDYVSMTPTKTSYTISMLNTGYTSDQEIDSSELNLWRVIRINDDNTVDMVSEYVSSVSVYFRGDTGYRFAVGTLNLIASQYENECYTVGSRYMGYNGQTEYLSIELSTSNSGTSSTSSSTTASKEAKGSGDTWYTTDTGLVKTATGSLIAYSVSDKTTAEKYWLASRYFEKGSYYHWRIRGINSSGELMGSAIYQYGDSNYHINAFYGKLRPIVTLKAGIKATGTGTSSDPYVLE